MIPLPTDSLPPSSLTGRQLGVLDAIPWPFLGAGLSALLVAVAAPVARRASPLARTAVLARNALLTALAAALGAALGFWRVVAVADRLGVARAAVPVWAAVPSWGTWAARILAVSISGALPFLALRTVLARPRGSVPGDAP